MANYIKPFATNPDASVMTNDELANADELKRGFIPKSKADSRLIGKLIQNSTAGAYVLGEFTSSVGGVDVDPSNATTFSSDFQNALKTYITRHAPQSDLSGYQLKTEAATQHQAISDEVAKKLAAKAPLANPTFTGTVKGTFSGNLTGNATSATKATQDGGGKVIAATYATKTEVTQGLAGKANSSHTHTKSQITDFPTIPDTSTLIPKTGDRGTLRGYETATLLEGSAINNDSPDVMYGGSNIVVENGLDSTSWTKVLYDQLNYAVGGEPAAPTSITLGNKWGWAGGTVPTLGGGIIVLHWNKNAGVASFISAKK